MGNKCSGHSKDIDFVLHIGETFSGFPKGYNVSKYLREHTDNDELNILIKKNRQACPC